MERSSEENILVAAQSVFIKKGLSGARMQEIADEAGISKALLHYYYRSKEQLFESVFTKIFTELLNEQQGVLDEETPLFEAIRKFYMVHLEFIRKNPRMPLFVVSEMERVPNLISKLFDESHVNIFEIIEHKIERALAAGEIKEISAQELFVNMLSLSVFQFLGFPIFKKLLGEKSDLVLDSFIEYRKSSLAEFVIDAIKK